MSRAWADGSNDISHLAVGPLYGLFLGSKKFVVVGGCWVGGLFDFNVSLIQTIVNI